MAGEHQVEGATVALGQAYGGAAQYFAMWVVGSTLDAVEQKKQRDRSRARPNGPSQPGARRVPRRGAGLARGERGACAAPTPATSSRQFSAVADQTREEELAHIERCKAWQRKLYDGGFAGLTVPVEYGGRGLTMAHERIWSPGVGAVRVDTGMFAVGARHGRCPRSSCTAPRSRSSATSRRCCAATRCGASCSASPAPAPTSPGSRPGGARRRRVGRQRPEGVELVRAPRRLGHPARPHRLGRPEAPRASPTSSST